MFVIISSTERWATAINNILSMDFDLSSGQQSTQVDIHTLYLCMIPSWPYTGPEIIFFSCSTRLSMKF